MNEETNELLKELIKEIQELHKTTDYQLRRMATRIEEMK
jgi:hypothetical protein